jgi:hypothetical protein
VDTLLTNAVDSIEIGVEDFRSEDPRRLISAVRNVQAGILLLCKERLRQLSPPSSDEVLIKARIVPALDSEGRLVFTGEGDKTVDERQLIDRFSQLGMSVDWAPLRKLTRHRNTLEHYRYTGRRDELREVIANSATMIRRLFELLELDPAIELDGDCWEFLLANATVFEAELARCKRSMRELKWRSPTMACAAASEVNCMVCGSELIELVDSVETDQQQARLSCRACLMSFQAEEIIWPTLVRYLGQDLHLAATQGGVPPLFRCDECADFAVVVEEGECARCGAGDRELRCEVCGRALEEDDRLQSDSRCLQHLDAEVALFGTD